ncbi:uncharacterized protein LOC143446016 isoform X2 [Clavelina lepadiformis]|uniref:uncharacterized protein LOC143446016 isoform X2 n=1 Tax=Clavelina lepadiformis TaxID=159417 RepID=UPI004041DC32
MAVSTFNEDLVELVKNNPSLYNWGLPLYKDEDFKHQTWKEIGEALGESVEVCRRRWRSLRTRYRRELTTMERGERPAHKRKWINNSIAAEYSSSEEGKDTRSMVFSRGLKRERSANEVEDSPTMTGQGRLDQNGMMLNITDPSEKLKLTHHGSYMLQPAQNHWSPAGDAHELSSVISVTQSILKDVQCKVSELKDDDEAEKFGRLVTAKLRKLKDQSNAQIKILNVIQEERLAEMHASNEAAAAGTASKEL